MAGELPAAVSEDTFLSDVHVEVKVSPDEDGTVLSRFVLSPPDELPSSNTCGLQDSDMLDEDGDLVIPRKHSSCGAQVLLIEHALSTKLSDVGQQVWRGALALSDFLLHHRDMFQDCVLLELGAGVGVVSVVCAMFCKLVFCTDVGTPILEICQRNVERNQSALDLGGEVRVRELNWLSPFQACSGGKFGWRQSDNLQDVEYILAADVVYDDQLTESFMKCLVLLNHTKLRNPATVYLAIEKRINFTLEALAPAVPAYNYFRSCLKKEYHTESGCLVQVEATQLDLSAIPQYMNYERVNEIELWKLSTSLKE